MSEPIFLRHSRGLTLEEIVGLTGATAPAAALLTRRIVNIAPLDTASPGDLSFFDNRNFAAAAAVTHAAACLTTAALASHLPAHTAALVVREPYRAFVTAARAMFPQALRPSSLAAPGAVAGAHVDASARLEDNVTIEPGAVVGPRAEVGSGTLIGANAVIGAGVRIGRDCSIGAGVVLTDALIGDRVIIHPGCKIGQDGFGFVMGGKGHLKVPQVGRVIVQNDVEIGAGTGRNIQHYPAAVDELVLTEPLEPMARRAERRLARHGRRGLVARASAEALPFEDASFDTVVSTMVLCSVGDVPATLEEIGRVLKPGGRLLFLEHVRSDEPRVARRQDRLHGAWAWFAHGCRCNQPTVDLLEGTFSVEHLERGELPLAPSIVRPLVTGIAVPG